MANQIFAKQKKLTAFIFIYSRQVGKTLKQKRLPAFSAKNIAKQKKKRQKQNSKTKNDQQQ